jgi:molybdopterin-guanine dinucleotide biosynthesis protein A
MGADKATLLVNGEALAARAARVLAEVCDPVVEVGAGVTSLAHVADGQSGPLAAFMLGLDALGSDGPALLLACDLPFVDVALLRALADHPGHASVVPVVDGREQFACARWSRAAIAAGRTAVAMGGARLAELATAAVEHLDDRRLTAAGVDVDTPDDLHRLGLS